MTQKENPQPSKSGARPHPTPQDPPAEESASEKAEVILSRKEYETMLARLKELEGMKERLLHAAADFDNAKKRLVRERDEFIKFSQEAMVRELLPMLDNFERALGHTADAKGESLKGIVAGIQLVRKQLEEVLKNQGLKKVKAVGEMFDPHLHEAIGFVHEPGREDEVVEEIEPGYFLHDRLLRAAKVRVRKSPQGSDPVPEKSEEEKQEEIT